MSIDLSIIIVNFNVKYFLEQCLQSVYNAIKNIESEVFVVDNNSADGSCQMVKEKFPEVILIENNENIGFSKANNQAIKLSKGDFVLLLNPDTLVEENTFIKCLKYIDTDPKIGGLGVKMIDGKGNFLPESKRGLPNRGFHFVKFLDYPIYFLNQKYLGNITWDFCQKIKLTK